MGWLASRGFRFLRCASPGSALPPEVSELVRAGHRRSRRAWRRRRQRDGHGLGRGASGIHRKTFGFWSLAVLMRMRVDAAWPPNGLSRQAPCCTTVPGSWDPCRRPHTIPHRQTPQHTTSFSPPPPKRSPHHPTKVVKGARRITVPPVRLRVLCSCSCPRVRASS
eukprot:scaffold29703_cov140-Isochrysis_galbana.AAC.3